MPDAVPVPCLMMTTSTVSEESLARDRQTGRHPHARTHMHTHTYTHARTYARTYTHTHTHTHTHNDTHPSV